jgi:hypothetical protein
MSASSLLRLGQRQTRVTVGRSERGERDAPLVTATRRETVLASTLWNVPAAAAGLLCGLTPLPADASVSLDSFGPIYDGLPYSSPKPVPIPRRTLRKDFAVSLLRSGYETVDALDVCPMDEFQKDFWLRRRAAWEPYTIQYDPLTITQGDVSSALYFDFIAAMQFETIDEELRSPRQTFKEYCGDCNEQEPYRYVTRNPLYKDDSKLPGFFNEAIGESIYNKLKSNVEDPIPLGEERQECSPVDIGSSVAKFFEDNGYSLKSECQPMDSMDSDGANNAFVLKSYGTVNLWALNYLSAKRSKVLPLYDVAVIQHLIRKKLDRQSVFKVIQLDDTSLKTKIELLHF